MIRGGLTALLVTYSVLLPSGSGGQGNAEGEPQRTKITLLGTLGLRHLETPSYPMELLRDILVRCRPDIILVALPANTGDEITTISVESVRRIRSRDAEVYVAADVAQRLGAQLVCFDIPEKEAHLRQYEERRDQTNQRMVAWMNWMSRNEGVSAIDLKTAQLASYLVKSLAFYDTPEMVNFAGFDALTRQKYFLYHELIPQILKKYDDFKSLAEDWEKLARAWTSRNAVMAQNIGRAAQVYAGKHLLVVVDADCRYALRDLLEKQTGITLVEYWEAGGGDAEETPVARSRVETRTHKRNVLSARGANTMEMEEFQKTVDVPVSALSSGAFSLENVNGWIHLQAGASESTRVQVTIRARAATLERARELVVGTRIDSQEEPERASVRVVMPVVGQNENLNTDFDISLPSQVAPELATVNGSIVVSGVSGKQQCRTVNGSIECNNVSSWTELATQNGSINLKCPTSLTGAIQVRATTCNGRISLEGVKNLSGAIEARVCNGAVSCQSPITVDHISGTRLQGRIGQAPGLVTLATTNGDVIIK